MKSVIFRGSRDLDVQPALRPGDPINMEFKSCKRRSRKDEFLQTLQPGFWQKQVCVFEFKTLKTPNFFLTNWGTPEIETKYIIFLMVADVCTPNFGFFKGKVLPRWQTVVSEGERWMRVLPWCL